MTLKWPMDEGEGSRFGPAVAAPCCAVLALALAGAGGGVLALAHTNHDDVTVKVWYAIGALMELAAAAAGGGAALAALCPRRFADVAI